MRQIARRFARQRRLWLVGACGLATLTTTAALAAPSALAATSVGITTSFGTASTGQNVISLNTSYDVGYAVTNTTGSAVSNLTFTDTLPTGVTLDNPIGLTNTAGTGTCGAATATNPTTGATSASGDSAVTITIASVPNASGTVCTVSLGIIASQPSVSDAPYKDSLSTAFASPKPVLTDGGLIVLSSPTVTLTRPTNGLVLRFGQIYNANFSCVTTDSLDNINSVFGDDSDGNQVNSGERIDTVDAGPNTFEADCYSGAGGGEVTQTIDYTVKPYILTAVKATPANGKVSFKTVLPAGKGVAELLDGKKVIGKTAFKVGRTKTAKVSVTPTLTGARLLAGRTVKVKLEVSYTPTAIGVGNDAITPQGPTVVTRSLKLTARS